MSGIVRSIVGSRLSWLLLLAPVSWVLTALQPPSVWLFVAAAAALVPAAHMIGHATEELAKRSGPTLGGIVNATFGNAAELIIGTVALRAGHIAIVKASLTGSIIGNLTFVFGMACFAGGLGRHSQRFGRMAAGTAITMLFLALVALIMPAVADLSISGSLKAHPPIVDRLSLWSALVLLLMYVAGLVFTLRTKRNPLRQRRGSGAPILSVRSAIALLSIATLLTTIEAEILIGALDAALDRLHMTELFTGAIVIAIVGNAAEHYSAVSAARRNQMTLAFEIAVGSSAQIALVVAPALVLMSHMLGTPMSLVFSAFELTAIILAVLAMALVALDGRSNWLEGLQLMAIYLILAIGFYLIPA